MFLKRSLSFLVVFLVLALLISTPAAAQTETFTTTPTNSATNSPSNTPTGSFTPTITPTFSITPTGTITDTPTNSPTLSPTSTPTDTPTATITPTVTYTPTITPTFFLPGTYLGNQAVVSATNSVTLNSMTIRTSIRFTARSNMTVGAVDLYFEGVTGSPQYRLSLQGDLAGVPNGSMLSSPATFTVSSVNWLSIPLGPTVGLLSGTVYHVVVEPVSANGSTYAVWRQFGVPSVQLYPSDQQPDPNMGGALDTGGGWSAVPSLEPIFVLRDGSSNVLDGNPNAFQGDEAIGNGSQMGQVFVVHGLGVTISSVGAYVRESATPSANLNWQVLNTITGVTAASGTLATPSQVGGSYQWVDVPIAPTALPGGIYLFILSSSSLAHAYQWSLTWTTTNIFKPYSVLTYGKFRAYGESGGFGPLTSLGGDTDFGFRMQIVNSPAPTSTPTPALGTVIGNQSVVGAGNDLVIDDQNLRGSVKFTARANMTVGGVDLYFDSVVSGGQYRVGIQGDSGGIPSGTYLSAPTTISSFFTPGWQVLPLASTVNLIQGTVYHIVVEAVNLNIGGYFVWRQSTSPLTSFYPLGQAQDPAMGIAQDTGGGWTAYPGYQPVFVLRDASAKVMDGVPYTSGLAETICGPSGYVFGQRFIVNGSPVTIKSIGAFAREMGTSSQPLSWIIRTSAGPVLGSGALAQPGQMGANFQWLDVPITPLVLPVGMFDLILTSSGSPSYYQWSLAASAAVTSTAGYSSISYGGSDSFGETGVSTFSALSIITVVPDNDFGFRFEVDNSSTPTSTPTPTPTGVSYFGNQSVVTGFKDLLLYGSTIKGSLRFTARASGAVSIVDIYSAGPIMTCCNSYLLGIQGDSGGVPNGTYLSAPATTNLYNFSQWTTVGITPVSMAAGNIYHIVVESFVGSQGGYFIWRQGTYPPAHLYPLDQLPDPNMGTAQNLGFGWVADPNTTPLFALRDTSQKLIAGNPYSLQLDEDAAGVTYQGQSFVTGASPVTINSVGAFLRQVGTPAGNLNWILQNVGSGVTVASGTLASPGQIGPQYQWYDKTILSNVLSAGTTYEFALGSTGSTIGNDYQWSMTSAIHNVPFPDYTSLSYGATLAFANGGTYGYCYFPDDDFPFRFRIDTTPVPTATPTFTPTDTYTPTVTYTDTPTGSPTYTSTNTATVTPTATPSNTPSDSPTVTPSSTPTNTATVTPTSTASNTPTESFTPTATFTWTHTISPCPTNTVTSTNTLFPTSTWTLTDTATLSPTFTPTNSPATTPTITFTDTPTGSPTYTSTNIPVITLTNTLTVTPTPLICGSGTSLDLSWNAYAPMPIARAVFSTAFLNGILYAPGYSANGGTLAYDPLGNTWSTKASMPIPVGGFGIGAVNGMLYVVGGDDISGNPTNTMEAYDPSTDIWTIKASMPTARVSMTVDVVNGILYAIGGFNGIAVLNTVEAYDPVADSWSAKSPMPTARNNLSGDTLNGLIYAVGGYNVISYGTVEVYNPLTDTWSTKASMPTARGEFLVRAMNGSLYACGGNNGSPLNTVEKYDPGSNSWSTQASMPTPRNYLAGATWNGILYVIGGFDNLGTSVANEAAVPVCAPFALTPTFTLTSSDTVTNTPTTSTMTNTPTSTATVTPTWTASFTTIPTDTFTLTPTWTPFDTATDTPTATPTPAGGVFNAVFYPNPATGPSVTLRLVLPAQADVKLKWFTLSGLKVQEEIFSGISAGTHDLSVELVDKGGAPLANGLYYVLVTAGGDKAKLKLLVLR